MQYLAHLNILGFKEVLPALQKIKATPIIVNFAVTIRDSLNLKHDPYLDVNMILKNPLALCGNLWK